MASLQRDLVVTENMTVDGVIDLADGWSSPAGADANLDQSDVDDARREQGEAADGFLVGRATFEQLRAHWPLRTDDTTGTTNLSEQRGEVRRFRHSARPGMGMHDRAARIAG